MFICRDCGGDFERAKRYTEPHGERYYGCIYCGSTDYVKAEECIICGGFAETVDGVCRKCLSDTDTLINFGRVPNGQINAFLSEVFDCGEIDEILSYALAEFLKDEAVKKKYVKRIERYIEDYGEHIAEFARETKCS